MAVPLKNKWGGKILKKTITTTTDTKTTALINLYPKIIGGEATPLNDQQVGPISLALVSSNLKDDTHQCQAMRQLHEGDCLTNTREKSKHTHAVVSA